MGALNTEQSNVEAVTALTNAPTIRKLLRVPDEDGKTNFEILKVQAIKELANGHNCEVTLRVDLAFGHEGLPVPENERYSVRTETVRRIDLKDVAEFAELELNDKQQYIGAGSTVEAVATLLGAALTEDDITVSPIKDVFWVRAKENSVGYTGQLTIAGEAAPVIKVPTSITATLSAADVNVDSAVTYTVDLLPADVNDKTYTVTADKPALVTIDTTAKTVTGKAAGVVKLTFQSVAAPTVKVEKTLNVKSLPVVKPTGIQVTNVPTEMFDGNEVSGVTVAVTPANAADKTYTVTTNDPDILTTTPDGKTITAVGVGNGTVTYTANGDPSVKQEFPISVTPPPPTQITVEGMPETLEVNGVGEGYVSIFPVNAKQEWTATSSNPDVVTVELLETRAIVKAIGTGTATITIATTELPSIKWTGEVVVPEDPNKDATYEAKVTFKPDFGATTNDFHAGYVNVGDIVNLVIRPIGLVVPQAITLTVADAGAVIELDTEHTLTPGVDLVVPMIITAADITKATSIYINIAGEHVGMSMGFYIKDPAVVPTTATFNTVPPNIPAGNVFGASVVLDVGVNEYIVREAVWSSSHPNDVDIELYSATNPLSAKISLGSGLAIDTVVKLTCVVDGITAVSGDIKIIAP